MNLLTTVKQKHLCNVTFINVISKVVISKVFIILVKDLKILGSGLFQPFVN